MSSTNYIQSPTVPVDVPKIISNEPQLSFNIEIELDALEEQIVNSTQVPLTEFVLVDRILFLHQLNQIKENLSVDLATAIEIANYKQQIITEAEHHAAKVVRQAEDKAKQILDDSEIVRQAELDGAKIRLKIERECEELKQTTLDEMTQLRNMAIAESTAIQTGADDYADNVLSDIEQKLRQMLIIIQNGRQELNEG